MVADGAWEATHGKHTLGTPIPATDGSLGFPWFGTGQLAAIRHDGTIAWQRHLGKDYAPFDIQWGHSSSPVVHGDSVLLLCDHPTASYLLALDKRTGKERWK